MVATSQDPSGWVNFCTTCLRSSGDIHWTWLAWIPSYGRAKRLEMDQRTPHEHVGGPAED